MGRLASVELRGLTKRFGPLAVVDNVSLKIDHGQLVCLLGPSGCGKTTTLRLIAGFLEPSDGEIHVGERLVSSKSATLPPEQRNMSMIFQSYALWPHMTVTENIVYGLRLQNGPRHHREETGGDPGHDTSSKRWRERYPGELSGGQQQRVALARALIVEPETLLLDEPLSNLDANLREEMRFEIRRLHDEYRYTTVYVTHDQSEAMTTADLIAVMNGGRSTNSARPRISTPRPDPNSWRASSAPATSSRARALDANHVAFAGATLESGRRAAHGRRQSAVVAIRQHDIGLSHRRRRSGECRSRHVVTRQVYLGAARDYMVEVADGTQFARHHADRNQRRRKAARSGCTLPPERCRALSR